MCCDAWPGLIEECTRAMQAVRPASKVMLQQKQGELFEMFVTSLREHMQKSGKIKINEQEMKNLTKQQSAEDEGE